MATVTIQELSQSQNLLDYIPRQKASIALYFPPVLKNGTIWMLKAEIYHRFSDPKNHF